MTLVKYGFKVPCNKCIACRLARSREWYIRLFHESTYYNSGVFLTLTYDNENLPSNLQLSKTDAQNFIKRLRYHHKNTDFKYFLSAEYGDKVGRPHYHIIILGLSIADQKYANFYNKGQSVKILTDGKIHQSWKKGNVEIATIDEHRIKYVTKYVLKKLYGKAAQEDNRQQPFALSSTKIGYRFALDNWEQLRNNLHVMCFGRKHALPRYYVKVIQNERRVGLEGALRLRGLINRTTEESEGINKYNYHEYFKRENQKLIQRNKTLKARTELKEDIL